MQKIKKRLILKEDINFDVLGENEKVVFESGGNSYSGKKINAGDLPLKKATRQTVGAVDVDTALANLGEKINSAAGPGTMLDSDKEIAFDPTLPIDEIQAAIDNAPRNLNGRTLEFIFPESVSQQLYKPIEWRGFFNGTLSIYGASSTNHSEIYDLSNIGHLFLIENCQCAVCIENIKFVHQKSAVGIFAADSPAVNMKNCIFYGMTEQTSYALSFLAANGSYINCVFNYDLPWMGNNIYNNNCRVNTDTALLRDTDSGYLGLYGATAPGNGAGIELYGKDSNTPELCKVIAETVQVDAETVQVDAETVQVDGKHIVRTMNGRTANAAGEIDGFFAPDFSAKISISKNVDYTAEINGFIRLGVMRTGSGGSHVKVYVNGEAITVTSGNDSYNEVLIPVKKGDVYKVGTGETYTLGFYPAR